MAAALLFAGYWTYVFLPATSPESPDILFDTSIGVEAEKLCARAVDEAATLPWAAEAKGPEERAIQIRDSTRIWKALVDDLLGLSNMAQGNDALLLSSWLDDWSTYLEDRMRYSNLFAAGQNLPFSLTERNGRSVAEYITAYAQVNGMPSCSAPDDV